MKNKFLAALLAFVLVISVFTIGIFAEDGDDEPVVLGAGEETESSGDSETTEPTEEGGETGDDVTKTEDTETTTPGEEVTTIGSDTTEKSWFEKNKNLVIALIIVGAIAVIFLVVFLSSAKFREKFKKFWKEYNAEFKKLVWPTNQQLVRNSAVVIVTIIVAGALLALLDLGFSQGLYALKDLIKLIWPVQ